MSSHRFVAEHSPFFLNRTLSDEERSRFEEQLAASGDSRDELAATLEAARIYGHTLPAEVLVDLVFGGGAEPRFPNALVERYLEVSPVGRAELELLRESRRALDAEVRGDGSNVVPIAAPAAAAGGVRGWRRMALAASLIGAAAVGLATWQWQQLEQREGRLAAVEDELRQALDRESEPRPPAADAAADPAVAQRLEQLESENRQLAAGKSDLVEEIERQDAEIEQLEGRIARMSRPRANVSVIDLYPGDMVLRGEPQADRLVVVERGDGPLALILNSGVGPDAAISGMRLIDEDGDTVWTSSEQPVRDELGTFTVSLPTPGIEPGVYAIELSSDDGTVVERYRIEIR